MCFHLFMIGSLDLIGAHTSRVLILCQAFEVPDSITSFYIHVGLLPLSVVCVQNRGSETLNNLPVSHSCRQRPDGDANASDSWLSLFPKCLPSLCGLLICFNLKTSIHPPWAEWQSYLQGYTYESP